VTNTLADCAFVVVDVDDVVLEDEPQLAPSRQRPSNSAMAKNLFMADSVNGELTRDYENTGIVGMSRNPGSGYGMDWPEWEVSYVVGISGVWTDQP
jgi:hypothetical protein